MRNSLKPIAITILVAITPILLWLASIGFASSSVTESINSFAIILALAGFSLYGWNIFLSTRLKVFENLYGGLLNLYKWHDITGSLAFMLLLIHPTLIIIKYANVSLISAYQFIKPSVDFPKMAGIFVLCIMFIAVFLSLYFKIKHELFIKLHIAMGLVFFLGAYHALLMSGSDVKQSIPLLIYGTIWVALALVVMLYRSIFHKSFRKTYTYSVSRVSSNDIYTKLSLKAERDSIKFSPGQFAFIKPVASELPRQSHPFSIVSSNSDSDLSFGIKKLGDFTSMVSRLRVGDVFEVEGAYGDFGSRFDKYQHQVWVAGGIGITPFVAMAKAITDQKVHLIYSVKSIREACFMDELKSVANTKPNFHIHIVDNSTRSSLLSTHEIMDFYAENGAIWLCGPPKMVKTLSKSLRSRGINEGNIITEEFNLA